MNDRAPLIVIAAGGTGGHMFPAQALAEAMLERGWRVKLSTDARGARYTGGFPHSTEIVEATSATFARGGLVAKAMVGPKIAGGGTGMVCYGFKCGIGILTKYLPDIGYFDYRSRVRCIGERRFGHQA